MRSSDLPTKLQRLLMALHPDRVLDETDRRVDEALNSFVGGRPATIEKWDAFRGCLMDLLRHVEANVLRLSKPVRMGVDFEWGRCCQVLTRVYGPNGEKAAFEIARTGNEGGLYSVLRKMARQIAEQTAQSEIAAKVSFFWENLTVAERFAASQEYLAMYGHLLPSELTEGSAARVRANLPKVLEEHPQLIRRLQRLGRDR